MIKVASYQYNLQLLTDWSNNQNKIEKIIIEAKQQAVQLILLPEYAGVEIGCNRYATEPELFAALQPLIPQYLEFYQNLAEQYQVYIQAGTIIEAVAPDQYVNRAYFFGPTRSVGYQDKLQLIEFEKENLVLRKGKDQTLFDTALGKIGIAICYDSEFPEIVRNLVNAGACLILVPSYTNSVAGYQRVSVATRARAMENQCYVMTSHVVGLVELSGSSEPTVGNSCIFGPIDDNFPSDGILAQGTMNKPGFTVAELSLEKLAWVRKEGKVHNFADAQIYNSREMIQIKKVQL